MILEPRLILKTLFPTLVESAHYAALIQNRITALEDKEGATNLYAAALSDADLSIQTHVELSLLAHFPQLPFFGEEWKSSRNTKYLSGSGFIDDQPFLITLDPIDGTRLYLDGHKLFQIILTVISRDSFEAVLVLFPGYGDYIYAVNGEGAYRGVLGSPFESAERLSAGAAPREIYLSNRFDKALPALQKSFVKIHQSSQYAKDRALPHPGSILRGDLCGAAVADAQFIDCAAMLFTAKEMGYLVQTLEGDPLPRPGDLPDLIFPNLLCARTAEDAAIIRSAIAGANER